MNGWNVELSRAARRDLRALDDGPKQAALELLEDLHDFGSALAFASEMRGYPGMWKVRFHHDSYRMIYLVARAEQRIVVKRIRPRPSAYHVLKG